MVCVRLNLILLTLAEAAGMQEWGSSPQRINVEQQPNSSQFVANPLMSKSEVKRLQWQKEKDDMQKGTYQWKKKRFRRFLSFQALISNAALPVPE